MEELKAKCDAMAEDLTAALELSDDAKAINELAAINLMREIVKAKKALQRVSSTINTFFAG